MSFSSWLREHLAERRLLGVEHLAAQRQDGLELAVAALLGGAAGGVALDDEQLALAGSVELQSASLPGRLSRCDTADLRCTCSTAAREALRARAARMTRSAMAVACVRFCSRWFSSAGADEGVDRRR